jgi:hypothetical protein
MPPVRVTGAVYAAPLLPLHSSSCTHSHSALARTSLYTPPPPTAPTTVVAIVREHQSSAIMTCHRPQVKAPASTTV